MWFELGNRQRIVISDKFIGAVHIESSKFNIYIDSVCGDKYIAKYSKESDRDEAFKELIAILTGKEIKNEQR